MLGRLSARVEPGWHLYSFSTPAAIPITIKLPENSPFATYRVLQPPPIVPSTRTLILRRKHMREKPLSSSKANCEKIWRRDLRQSS